MTRFKERIFAAWVLLASGLFAHDSSSGTVYSTDRLEEFYDVFLCEEKNVTHEVDVTGPCTQNIPPAPIVDNCGAILSPPAIPPLAAPSPSLDLIPIVLVNNTGKPDTDVYFVAYGQEITGCTASGPTVGSYAFVSFGPQPGPFTTTGSYVAATGANMPPSATYSYAFSDIPLTNGQRIIYVPYLDAGIIIFSVDSAASLVVNANSIANPVATDPGDPAYNVVYGTFEMSFFPPNCPTGSAQPLNQLTVDFTCVDFYGLSIYLNLFTQNPLRGLPQNRPSGIYQSRHHTLCELQNTLNTASSAALAEWTGLVLDDGMGKILRVVSPGYSMSHTGGSFDPNYFDNAGAYGFSWAEDVWTGAGAYYKSHPLTIVVNDGTTYNGLVDMSGNFNFRSTSSSELFTIPWTNVPIPPSPFTTSTAIFNVATYMPGMTYFNGTSTCTLGNMGCDSAHANQLTEYFSASIAAGLLPGKVNKIVAAGYPPSVMNSYYTPNGNLNPPGATTGPWFDLYSKGILGNSAVTGNAVYTYAYDDFLYAQAPVSGQVAPSQAVIDSTTYLTIFIGPYTDN